jgi:P-type E1-E2 ATPase
MIQDQNLVRRMEACETMGGANYICTDKTGTLTKNEMNIVRFFDGVNKYNFLSKQTTSSEKNLKDLENNKELFKHFEQNSSCNTSTDVFNSLFSFLLLE